MASASAGGQTALQAPGQGKEPPAVQTAASQESRPLFLSLVSGTYASDQVLSVEAASPQTSVHLCFRDTDGAEGPWLPYREPVTLSAVPGERREYRIIVRGQSRGAELERRELWVRIDRRPPAAPRIQPESGSYWDPVALKFSLEGKGDRFFYTLHGDLAHSPTAWKGEQVIAGRRGEKEDFVIQAYAEDEAGNRSPIVTSRYRVDARDPSLEIASPVRGGFANPQALALTYRNLLWVRYTLDGSDPVTAGLPYTGPTTIKKRGLTTVRVAAQPRAAGRPVIRKEVTCTYEPEQGTGLLLDPESGTVPNGTSPRILSVPEGTLHYTLWEKTPAESDAIAVSTIALHAETVLQRPLVLRLRNLSSTGYWGGEYRYFFSIGQGKPTPPAVELGAAEPLRSPARAHVSAAEDCLLFVTTDGSMPGYASLPSSGLVDLQPGTASARVRIKAVAVNSSGIASVVSERQVSLDPDAGSKPVVTVTPDRVRSSAAVAARGGASDRYVFEITSDGSEPPVPGPGSSRMPLPLSLSVPFGMERTFRITCASLDEAGRALAASAPVAVTINRRPPPQPRLSPPASEGPFDMPLTVTMSSTGTIFYTLTSDGTTPRDPTPGESHPPAPLFLQGTEGGLQTYRLKIAATDVSGNMTEIYGPFLYTLDLRNPQIPPMSGIADGGRYNSRSLSPVLADSSVKVLYTFSRDGQAPPDPDAASPALTNETTFIGDEGTLTPFRVKLLAVSRNGRRMGERREISFFIDLKNPDVPIVGGIVNGGRYAQPVTITTAEMPGDVRLYYSVSSDGTDPEDPVTKGMPLDGPLSFDAAEGTRREVTVRIATRDGAGNRSLFDRRYRFAVDRELPEDPVVSGLPPGGISAKPVTLMLKAPEGTIHYSLTDDGSMPEMPTEKSPMYASPLVLTGQLGVVSRYRLLARSFNALGNASRAATIFSVTVDRTTPGTPEEPRIIYSAENPTVAYIAWSSPPSGRLLYRLKGASTQAGEFIPYTGPVSVLVAGPAGTMISAEAVLENNAGTRGFPALFQKAVGRQAPAPSVLGPRDGAIYAGKVEIRVQGKSGQVRYEVSTDGKFAPAVTAASPLADGPLSIDATDGETIEVRIAARTFDETGAALPSDEVRLGFTIDRTPPDPPLASGIEDGGYYQDGKTVTLLSAEGTIYYSLSSGGEGSIPAQNDSNRYRSPLPLEAKSGQTVSHHIVAYTVDAAGNRSRETRSWNVTMDQKIVYASATGNDYADGVRGAPVRSLSRALQIAAESSRKTVFLSGGAFAENAQVVIAGDVTIVGGLDPETWLPLGLERWSVIAAASPWKSGTSLLSMAGGKVTIKGVEFRDATRALRSLVMQGGGELALEQVTLSLADIDTARGLVLRGGNLTLSKSTLRAAGVRHGALLHAAGGTVAVSGSEFSAADGVVDFVNIDVSGVRSVAIRGTRIVAGAGLKTRGVRATRSRLAINTSLVQSGAGSEEAIAIDLEGSDCVADNCDITASASARSPVGVRAVGSTVLLSGCRISISGRASAVGINAHGGDLVVSRCTIKGGDAPEYVFLTRVEDATALIANSLLLGGDAGESVCVTTRGGAVRVVNTTILAGSGSTLTAAVLVQGDRFPSLINTILMREGADRGAAIVQIGGRSSFAARSGAAAPVILTNAFAGWERLLRVDSAVDSGKGPVDVKSPDALNALDGDPFEGTVQGNIVEAPSAAFPRSAGEDYHLARSSACVNAGTDLRALISADTTIAFTVRAGVDIMSDLEGKPRPASRPLVSPGPPRGWDIGAYEYSE